MPAKKSELTPEQERTRLLYYVGFDFLQNLGGDIAEEGEHIRKWGVFGHAGTNKAKEHLIRVQRMAERGLEAIERLDAEVKKK